MKFLHKFFLSDKCVHGGKLHNFSPRYSEKQYDGKISATARGQSIRKILYYDVYEHDICTWCGKIVIK